MVNNETPTGGNSLRVAIARALEADQITATAPIDVDIEGGRAILSGAVSTPRIKEAVARIVQGVPGVSVGTNELVVGPSVPRGGNNEPPRPRLYRAGGASRASQKMYNEVQGALTEPNSDEDA